MVNLNPATQQFLVLLLGALLTLPGLAALYRGMHRDLEEQKVHLQVESLANEVQRLQVLTDDQARDIARLRVQVTTLQATQKGLMDMAKRLSQQVETLGQVPIVDIEKLSGILS